MDPLLMEDGSALKLASNILGTPTFYNSDGALQNFLLKESKSKSQNTIYELRFHKGLKWSDGKEFHADQFLLALKRLSETKVKAALSELFPKIDFSRTKVNSATEIIVVLKDPDALFLQWCSLPPFAPMREDILRKMEAGNFLVPTLGDYELVEWVRSEKMKLKINSANEGIFSLNKKAPQEVTIRYIREEATLQPLMKSGKLDVVMKIPQLQMKQFEKMSEILEKPIAAMTYLGLNLKNGFFSNITNRQMLMEALSFAQRENLANVLGTQEWPARVFLPEVLWPKGFSLGTEKARPGPTLKQAKTQKSSIKIQTDPGQRNLMIVEFVQSQTQKEMGIKTEINTLDWRAHMAKLKTGADDLFRLGWQNPVTSPYVFYQVLVSTSPNNFTGFKNKKYDELVRALRRSSSQKETLKLTQKLEQILLEEVPIIPLLQQKSRIAYSSKIKRISINPLGVVIFKDIEL